MFFISIFLQDLATQATQAVLPRCQDVETAVGEMPQHRGATQAHQHTLRRDIAGKGGRPGESRSLGWLRRASLNEV